MQENENVGGAVFEFKDKEKNITQKFVFNLRYYVGASGFAKDGLYEFSANGTKSFPFGKINLKRVQRRQNNESSEFILIFEQKVVANETIRASARISLNQYDSFIKWDVEMNEVPIKMDKSGKDVVVDWYMLDGDKNATFDSGKKLYVDANGLQMIDKELMHRKEYAYSSNNTVSANYYPVTSAIAIRNEAKNSSTYGRQITIMNDRS